MADLGLERISGPDIAFREGPISSITVAIGDVLAFDRSNEVLILATSSSSREDIAGVAREARTTANTTVLYEPVDTRSVYKASLTNNSNTAHNFHRMVLTDEDAVNNTGTDSTADTAVVEQLYPIGAASDKRAAVRFIEMMDRA